MEDFISIVYAIVFVIVIITIIRKKKNRPSGQSDIVKRPMSSGSLQSRDVSSVQARTAQKNGRPNGVSKNMTVERNTMMMEDRQHDWLARERYEEKLAQKRVSEMFKLKQEHRSSCEAEMIKQFHESHCEADKVDSAET
ncbi:MAG: hypothetical protein KBT19_08990 [Lachnospiraceae bacterium]|nr:hypothetical protein [Candidatus Colinaster equi]